VKNPKTLQNRSTTERLADRAAGATIESARSAIDAASLVFMHSIIDSGASRLLQLTSLAGPEDWYQFMDEKKLPFSKVRQDRHETLYIGLLLQEMARIERNTSLPWKGARLRQLCKPEDGWTQMRYDETGLQRVDKLRHDIVHGEMLGNPIPDAHNDIRFLENTGWYFWLIVGKRYGLELSND